jgi:hypothetical protein
MKIDGGGMEDDFEDGGNPSRWISKNPWSAAELAHVDALGKELQSLDAGIAKIEALMETASRKDRRFYRKRVEGAKRIRAGLVDVLEHYGLPT